MLQVDKADVWLVNLICPVMECCEMFHCATKKQGSYKDLYFNFKDFQIFFSNFYGPFEWCNIISFNLKKINLTFITKNPQVISHVLSLVANYLAPLKITMKQQNCNIYGQSRHAIQITYYWKNFHFFTWIFLTFTDFFWPVQERTKIPNFFLFSRLCGEPCKFYFK